MMYIRFKMKPLKVWCRKMDLPKIDNSNLWDKTYNILKEKIIRREFLGNQKLLIPELAAQLGVSRTPIRDALNRLEMDGLVKTVSKVGTFVNAIDVQDVMNATDTRMMLEFWVVDKLSSCTKQQLHEEIRRLESIVELSLRELDALTLDQYLQKDYNLLFHLEFMQLGGNSHNVAIYKSLMNYRFIAASSSLISKEMVTAAIKQHQNIIAVLKLGDAAQMREVIREHLEDSKNRLIAKITANGGSI